MIKRAATALAILAVLAPLHLSADMMSKPSDDEKSPSKQQVLWTETDVGYDAEAEFNYVGAAHTDFGTGNGIQGKVPEYETDIKNIITRRALMAFLLHFGAEWQRMGFAPDNTMLLPDQFSSIKGFLATDFRWSKKDMLRIQFEPGYYGDMSEFNGPYFHVPMAFAYTRIPSDKFQWSIGVSFNDWRKAHWLPGGGFNYYMTDRWKLKFMLPTPQIEYKVNDYVHTWVGADFRGDTFRVARNFGTVHGNPSFNGTVVDYQEIRVGTGVSWNIRPLIEINAEAGFMADRSFDYWPQGVHSNGRGAPYISLNLRALFQVVPDKRPIKDQIRSMQYEFPFLRQFFRLPS